MAATGRQPRTEKAGVEPPYPGLQLSRAGDARSMHLLQLDFSACFFRTALKRIQQRLSTQLPEPGLGANHFSQLLSRMVSSRTALIVYFLLASFQHDVEFGLLFNPAQQQQQLDQPGNGSRNANFSSS